MSLREIINKPEIWIPALVTIGGSIWGWFRWKKRRTKVETDKTELEKDDLQFTLRTKMEKHYDTEIETLKKRIFELETRDKEKDRLIGELTQQIADQNEIIDTLKSNRNFNNTLNQ